MSDRPATPVTIGLIVGGGGVATGILYAMIFAEIPGGGIVRAVIAVGVALFVAALAVVVMRRVSEIKREDPDDYSKY